GREERLLERWPPNSSRLQTRQPGGRSMIFLILILLFLLGLGRLLRLFLGRLRLGWSGLPRRGGSRLGGLGLCRRRLPAFRLFRRFGLTLFHRGRLRRLA